MLQLMVNIILHASNLAGLFFLGNFEQYPKRMTNQHIYLTIILFVLMSAVSQQNCTAQQVRNEVNQTLQYPWAGGLNSCQFGEIDLNGNGIKDLFVFDRQGNRILTFINEGIPGEISYAFAPEYTSSFPQLVDWVQLVDYDGDGKEDIFTYSPGWAGIQVYRNISVNELAFERVVFPYLTSFQGGGYVNILSTNADYPAIVDIDGDGDLDMLTFWALGTYIQQHTNQSVEKYGHADSLDFLQTEFCWGRIAENEENNIIYLDTCLFKQKPTQFDGGYRHRGATMRVIDVNNSGLPDLILADVDYPGLTLLTNGGSIDNAFMVGQDTAFPSYDVPVRLFSMPATALVDVNNNGLKDLLVSPFDPSPVVSENKNSIWLYLNEGTAEQPVFRLHTKNFLQSQMIDLGAGAYPILFDVNQNGLLDLVVGNFGYYKYSWYDFGMLKSRYLGQIAFFENIGEPGLPAFQLMDNDLAGLSSLGLRGLVPAMADLTGNGLADMLIGNENGNLIFVEQTSAGNWTIREQEFAGIQAGTYSAPQLFDVDGDAVVDLVIGKKNGTLSYYKGVENDGQISFQYVTDELGGVNVTDFNISFDGYSTPNFFRSPDDELLLAVGSEQGKIFLFDQVSGNLPDGPFREIDQLAALLDTNLQSLDAGMRSSASLADLYGNGSLVMMAGNYGGGLQLFNANIDVNPGLTGLRAAFDFKLVPNPARDKVRLVFDQFCEQPFSLRIYNIAGQLAMNFDHLWQRHEMEIDIGNLQKGIYMIELKTCSKSIVNKLVVL
jgi:hypothetical protein